VTDDCIICQKHRGEGPLTGQLIARVEGFEIWSARTDELGRAPLGYVFIESEQHVPYVTDLSDDDAAALGLLRTRLARALRDVLGAEFVIAVVLGMGVPHFHEHLLPRMVGTPAEVAWHDSDSALPWVYPDEIAELNASLRDELGLEAPDGG
jgi:diadenosine tetraphosphate (Ap4A) HIT family hydrolase